MVLGFGQKWQNEVYKRKRETEGEVEEEGGFIIIIRVIIFISFEPDK